MGSSKAFGTQRAVHAHLVRPGKQGGLPGEIADLRADIDRAFLIAETPGAGGSSVVAVEEWTNPPALDTDLFMVSKAFTAAVQVLTAASLTGSAATPPRNVVVGVTIAGGVGAGTIIVAGLDYDGNAISENFAIPAATADVTGAKAFASVTSVTLPAHGAAFTGSVVVGSGNIIGLASKVKVRNAVPAILAEMLDGVMLHGGANGAATAVNQVATAVNSGMQQVGEYATIAAPIAAELISIVAVVASADGAAVIAAQPDVPRKVQLDIIEGGAPITAGIGTLIGRGMDGTVVTQVFDLTGGAKTVISDDVYMSVASFTVSGLVGGGAGTTLSIGVASALGLPVPAGAADLNVYAAFATGAAEAVGVVDAVARSIIPTTAPNAAAVFQFKFYCTVTPVQVAHNHTQNAHSHVDAAGTFATPTVGAPHGTFLPGTAPNGAHDYVLVYERDNS